MPGAGWQCPASGLLLEPVAQPCQVGRWLDPGPAGPLPCAGLGSAVLCLPLVPTLTKYLSCGSRNVNSRGKPSGEPGRWGPSRRAAEPQTHRTEEEAEGGQATASTGASREQGQARAYLLAPEGPRGPLPANRWHFPPMPSLPPMLSPGGRCWHHSLGPFIAVSSWLLLPHFTGRKTVAQVPPQGCGSCPCLLACWASRSLTLLVSSNSTQARLMLCRAAHPRCPLAGAHLLQPDTHGGQRLSACPPASSRNPPRPCPPRWRNVAEAVGSRMHPCLLEFPSHRRLSQLSLPLPAPGSLGLLLGRDGRQGGGGGCGSGPLRHFSRSHPPGP